MTVFAHRSLRVGLVVVLGLALAIPGASIALAGDVSVSAVAPQVAALAPDAYESDDTTGTAKLYNPATMGNSWTSYRTFDGTNQDPDDMSDFIKVTVAKGTPIWVETQAYDFSYWYDTTLEITTVDGTRIAYDDDNDYRGDTYSDMVYIEAPETGTYYIEVFNNADEIFAYQLHVTLGDARRVSGANRFKTATEVSRLLYDGSNDPENGTGYGPDTVFVANAYNPADALAGAALAAQTDGALLLTNQDSLPWETATEINRLLESYWWNNSDTYVYVLGGTAAVSKDVMDEIADLRHVLNVERISGADRYATAAKVGDATGDIESFNTTAFIVNGTSWADALAVAPVAAYNGSVVLMTMQNDVPAVTMSWLDDNGITDVVVAGGSAVVGPAAIAELESLVGTSSVEVLAGSSRYQTARFVAEWGVDNAGMTNELCVLASGENFADALTAAPVSWWYGGPLLLTTPASLHSEVGTYFNGAGYIGEPNGSDSSGAGCFVLGGESAISSAAYMSLRDLWKVVN